VTATTSSPRVAERSSNPPSGRALSNTSNPTSPRVTATTSSPRVAESASNPTSGRVVERTVNLEIDPIYDELVSSIDSRITELSLSLNTSSSKPILTDLETNLQQLEIQEQNHYQRMKRSPELRSKFDELSRRLTAPPTSARSESEGKSFTANRTRFVENITPELRQEVAEKACIVNRELTDLVQQVSDDLQQLNPPSPLVSLAVSGIQTRSQSGYNSANVLEKLNETSEDRRLQIIQQIMPNLAVNSTDISILPPPTIEQIESTKQFLAEQDFEVTETDENAPLHILNAIAIQMGMNFILTPFLNPDAIRDSCAQPATFAMANDALTENDLFLLGSNSRCHHTKGGILHLKTPFEELISSKEKHHSYLDDVKSKLAELHHQQDIVIALHTSGSNMVVFLLNIEAIPAKREDYERVFGDDFLDIQEIPAISNLHVNPNSFAPTWNRDFRNRSRVIKGLTRGGFKYYPPEHWLRYGLNVAGHFDDGDDTWLGDQNVEGEWAVAYHGTDPLFVKAIMESPLRSGENNVHGKGIYCSPLIQSASDYAASSFALKTKQGIKRYRYVFMCRVNVRNVCHCKDVPCPNAQDPQYSLHVTMNTDDQYWFVNENNGEYQNIRTYGLLVQEEDGAEDEICDEEDGECYEGDGECEDCDEEDGGCDEEEDRIGLDEEEIIESEES
jgi:hypothetical protein